MRAAEPANGPTGSTRRAQPLRQTRNNPSRSMQTASRPLGGRAFGVENAHPPTDPPGFFPAITHFTDCIAALPKEIVRHFTLLKEVDAKACGPEESLRQLTQLALNAPRPKRKRPSQISRDTDPSMLPDAPSDGQNAVGSESAAVPDDDASHNVADGQGRTAEEDYDMPRRHLFLELRYRLSELLMTLDEKNHVLSTANEALAKQTVRLESSLPYIDNEISEEARHGSLTHWAYSDKSNGKINNAPIANERPRREAVVASSIAAGTAAMNEEAAAARSETRREAMLAKKQKATLAESDFDDVQQGRNRDGAMTQPGTSKKSHHAKTKRPVEGAGNSVGLGITSNLSAPVGNPPPKKRKTEKAAPTGHPAGGVTMERSNSGAISRSNVASKGTAGSPRSTPVVDGGKKRARGGVAPTGTVRKRNTTNASAGQPPSLASSPINAAFPSKDAPRSSPAPSNSHRPATARARQNSTQSAQDPRHRPSSSASNKIGTSNGVPASTADLNSVAGMTGRNVADVKATMKEAAVPNKGEHLIEEKDGGDVKGALLVGSQKGPTATVDKSMKKEDVDTTTTTTPTPAQTIQQTTVTGTRGGSRASKNSTPIAATFSDATKPSRSHRASDAALNHHHNNNNNHNANKRSHKKGAGLAAQLAAASAATADDEGSSMQGDDEEDDDESEPRYCYCNGVSYGEMVACDADACPREWFHLECVGLSKAPTKNGGFPLRVMYMSRRGDAADYPPAKWFCDECKETLKKSKTGGGNR
ncbi:MAG: hypothetical protein M1833_004564 [Piccolia ochrophora]|nr:MAG: hypothetical protein M1833_004564 [Piccolia ochrophora]